MAYELNSMYIKREAPTPLEVHSRNVCFVCGSAGHRDYYWLRVKANPENPSEPFFPFLNCHEPPAGYPGPLHDSVVSIIIVLIDWPLLNLSLKPRCLNHVHFLKSEGVKRFLQFESSSDDRPIRSYHQQD